MSRRPRFKRRRWMQRNPILHHARAIAPVLLAISLSAVANAQGTMDFSGAQTLMSTFNVCTSAVESQVELPHGVQIVTEEPVSSIGRK
jgi:hypothetical protein